MTNYDQNGVKNNSYKYGNYVRVNTTCSQCKNQTSKLKSSKRAFCNNKCKNTWQKTHVKGNGNPNFNKKHPHLNIGRQYSDSTKLKLREAQIKNVERQVFNGLPMMPCVGKYETRILDFLEKSFNYTIIRQHKISGYFLDGYCPALNLAIEIDEPFHKEQLDKDSYRQNVIQNNLGCTFLRLEISD